MAYKVEFQRGKIPKKHIKIVEQAILLRMYAWIKKMRHGGLLKKENKKKSEVPTVLCQYSGLPQC